MLILPPKNCFVFTALEVLFFIASSQFFANTTAYDYNKAGKIAQQLQISNASPTQPALCFGGWSGSAYKIKSSTHESNV